MMTGEENVVMSPLSIAACLSMIWTGATKSSVTDMEFQSLFSSSSPESIPTLVNLLQKETSTDNNNTNNNTMLSMSNSLWMTEQVDANYVKEVESFAAVQPLPSTVDVINEWVAKETHDYIPKLFSSDDGVINENTVAIAINAIYFQGMWTHPFPTSQTQPGTFTTFDGTTHKANFMNQLLNVPIAQNVKDLGGATLLQLDYAAATTTPCPPTQTCDEATASDVCAILVLPQHNTLASMKQVIQGLTQRALTTSSNKKDLYSSLLQERTMVRVSLPRFQLSTTPESLKAVLQTMGFQTAFSSSEENQFLRMTPHRRDTYLDDLMAAATLKVTEEGTIATAATGAIMMTRSLPTSIDFHRPFLFMVLHRPTGTPLFLSHIHKPEFL